MTTDTVRIREADLEDIDTVVEFNMALASETENKTLDRRTLTVGVRQALTDKRRSQYYVAEIGSAIVGQTMFTTEWSDWRNGTFWWIQSVYIDPAHRGRGIFRMLYEHIRSEAKRYPDIRGIRLYVHKDNQRAIETYRRMGMTLTDYMVCEEDWSAATGHP